MCHWRHILTGSSAFTIMLMSMVPLASAQGDVLMTDLSERKFSINATFTGKELLLFGFIGDFEPGEDRGDVVVVIYGPKSDFVVREKSRVAGIWLNTSSVTFNDIPEFYTLYSNRPLKEFVPEAYLTAYGIGLDYIPFETSSAMQASEIVKYRDAAIAERKSAGLYSENESGVTIIGNHLFRANVSLPANISSGNYIADIYLIRDGALKTIQSSTVFVDQEGLDAFISDLAHGQPTLYGLMAVFLASVLGWIAALVFNRN